MARAKIVVVPSSPPASPVRLGVIAVAAFVTGVLLVRATIARPEHEEEAVPAPPPEASVPAPAAETPEPAPPVAPAPVTTTAPEGPVAADAGTEHAPPAVAGAVVNEAPTPAPSPSSEGATFVPGRIAYLQCSGTEPQEGPSPCPRDLEFEEAVWQVLRDLTTCAPSIGTGYGDLRVDLAQGAVTEFRFRTPPTSPALPRPPLERCVAERLPSLRTSLPAEGIVVSFRFELAPVAP